MQPGAKRPPSSLVQATISIGRARPGAGLAHRLHRLQRRDHAVDAVEAPAIGLGVHVAAGEHRRGAPGRRLPAAGTGCRARPPTAAGRAAPPRTISSRRALRSSGVRQARLTPRAPSGPAMAPISPISISRRHCRASLTVDHASPMRKLLGCPRDDRTGGRGRRSADVMRRTRPGRHCAAPSGGLEPAAFAAMMGVPGPERPRDGGEHRSVLSTHVLNHAQGIPAEGVAVELWRLEPREELVLRTTTTADGRTAEPLLPHAAFEPGRYELRFALGAYFGARGLAADPPFHDVVPEFDSSSPTAKGTTMCRCSAPPGATPPTEALEPPRPPPRAGPAAARNSPMPEFEMPSCRRCGRAMSPACAAWPPTRRRSSWTPPGPTAARR